MPHGFEYDHVVELHCMPEYLKERGFAFPRIHTTAGRDAKHEWEYYCTLYDQELFERVLQFYKDDFDLLPQTSSFICKETNVTFFMPDRFGHTWDHIKCHGSNWGTGAGSMSLTVSREVML